MKPDGGTVVVFSNGSSCTALPSGCPLAGLDLEFQGTKGLVLLIELGFTFELGPRCVLQKETLKIHLLPRQARDLLLVREVCTSDGLSSFRDSDLSWQSEMVPRIVLKAGLAAICGLGFVQGKASANAEALSVHVARTSPRVGIMTADVSLESCQLLCKQGCEPVRPAALVAYVLRSFHLVQCPVLLLSGPAQAGDWCREARATFQAATGYHCAEVLLKHVSGLATWWCCISAPEMGKVPLEVAIAKAQAQVEGDEVPQVCAFHSLCIQETLRDHLLGRRLQPASDLYSSPQVDVQRGALGTESSLVDAQVSLPVAGAARVAAVDAQPLARDSAGGNPLSQGPASPVPYDQLDLTNLGELALWHLKVVADGDKALFEVALQLQSLWNGPPNPQTGLAKPVLLFGVNEEQELLHHASRVLQDQEIALVAFGQLPSGATAGVPPFRFPRSARASVTVRDRLVGLQWQAQWLASDQMHFALACIAHEAQGPAQVVDPLLLCRSRGTEHASQIVLEVPAGGNGSCVISAVVAQGHWVTLCWRLLCGFVVSWASLPMETFTGPLVDAVAEANHMMSRVFGLTVASFRFRGGPVRPSLPGFCGHLALADLSTHLLGSETLSCEDAVRRADVWARAFVDDLASQSTVPAPWHVAGVVPPLLEHGLASVLKDKGVPAAVVQDRVKEAIQRVGRGPLQQALQAPNQWRELKLVCSNAAPPFQLVLPSELKGLIDAKVAAGEEVAPRRKQKAKVQRVPASPPTLHLPVPEHVQVAKGVFEQDGAELPQLLLQDIGPQAKGVVVVNAATAGPYLKIDQPVSKQALGLLVLGPLDLGTTTLKHESVRFQATCSPATEPVLLAATLLQIGDRFVTKSVPSQRMTLDLVPSVILRLAVYRDQWPEPWDVFVQKPEGSVLEVCPALRTCTQVGCSCGSWHGTSGPGVPEALLEVWGRTFATLAFKTCNPLDASVFNAFLRVPEELRPTLLAVSGDAGVYFEPRGAEPRDASTEFSVFWLPKADFHTALVFRQTHADVLGLARVAMRFGVRCTQDKTEALHGLLRPATAFMHKEGARTFHAGPWLFGTQRSTLSKAFKEWGWEAKPLQPIPRPSGTGLWWAIQALTSPPQAVLHIQQGEVLISEVQAKVDAKPVQPQVVAARATLQALSAKAGPATDPLQTNDPWAAALGSRASRPVPSNPQAPALDFNAVVKQVESSLQAKITAQVAEANHDLVGRVTSLESSVSEVVVKVQDQETRLKAAFQDLFNEQTQRIEALLAPKRQRQE